MEIDPSTARVNGLNFNKSMPASLSGLLLQELIKRKLKSSHHPPAFFEMRCTYAYLFGISNSPGWVGTSFAQDNPITAKTSTITVTLKRYNDNSVVCKFNANSVKYDVHQTVNIGSQSSGAGAGKISFNPLNIVKPVDSCSPTLFAYTASGTAFSEVLMVISPPAGDLSQSTYVLRIGLAAATDLSDAAADKTVIQEQVLFEYGNLTLAELSPSGVLLSCHGWDRVRNIQDSSHCSELAGVK